MCVVSKPAGAETEAMDPAGAKASASDATRIAERYGRGRRRRPGLVLSLLLLVAVVLVAWFGWALWMAMTPKVTSGLETWKATGENSVEVTYSVRTSDPDVVATCSVEAQDADSGVVGQQTMRVKAGRHTVRFATERRALRVVWDSCTAPGQQGPR